MPVIGYKRWNPKDDALRVVAQANDICADYAARGYTLTLRQLYYQFVARRLMANRIANYKRLGDICNDARMAGRMDWDYLEDRTRNFRDIQHWDTPSDIIQATQNSYRLDLWATQPIRVEVWVEKDALVSVIERAADTWDVGHFSSRGYNSTSEMWVAAQRHLEYLRNGQGVVVLHLGDHDPSGLQMSRDNERRLLRFVASHLVWDYGRERALEMLAQYTIRRIALNVDQIVQYNPPPNPAKITDSRYRWYLRETGLTDSWELDALDPDVLNTLIATAVEAVRTNPDAWQQVEQQQERERELLRRASTHWDEVVSFLEERFGRDGQT